MSSLLFRLETVLTGHFGPTPQGDWTWAGLCGRNGADCIWEGEEYLQLILVISVCKLWLVWFCMSLSLKIHYSWKPIWKGTGINNVYLQTLRIFISLFLFVSQDRSLPTWCPESLAATDIICPAHRTTLPIEYLLPEISMSMFSAYSCVYSIISQIKLTFRKERSDNHILMFSTFLSLKWGISYFLAFLAEVIWLKSFANKNLWRRLKKKNHKVKCTYASLCVYLYNCKQYSQHIENIKKMKF